MKKLILIIIATLVLSMAHAESSRIIIWLTKDGTNVTLRLNGEKLSYSQLNSKLNIIASHSKKVEITMAVGNDVEYKCLHSLLLLLKRNKLANVKVFSAEEFDTGYPIIILTFDTKEQKTHRVYKR